MKMIPINLNVKIVDSRIKMIDFSCSCYTKFDGKKSQIMIIFLKYRVMVMVFNATFNNISVISWRSVDETRVHGENHRPTASN